MSANLETGFFVRVPAWHGLGTVIADAPKSDEALVAAGLDWHVEQAPAYIDVQGERVGTGMVVNYRDSDNKVLGTVSDKYKVLQNDAAFAFTDNLLATGDVRYETAGSLDGGKTVWMLARLPEIKILGDEVDQFLLIANSHDGRQAVRVTATPTRVVCQNTLNLALANAKRMWSFQHTGDIDSKLEEARKTLTNANEYSTALNAEAERLVKIKYSKAQVQEILNKLFPVEDDEVSALKLKNMEYLRREFIRAYNREDLNDIRDTAYGLVNAASDFVGHTAPLRANDNHQANILKSFMVGNKFLDTTYSLVG